MALPDDTRGRWVICKLTRASRIGMSATRVFVPLGGPVDALPREQ